jgi:hypothetical protein
MSKNGVIVLDDGTAKPYDQAYQEAKANGDPYASRLDQDGYINAIRAWDGQGFHLQDDTGPKAPPAPIAPPQPTDAGVTAPISDPTVGPVAPPAAAGVTSPILTPSPTIGQAPPAKSAITPPAKSGKASGVSTNPFFGSQASQKDFNSIYSGLVPFTAQQWRVVEMQNAHPTKGYYYDPDSGRSIPVVTYSLRSSDPSEPTKTFAIDPESNKMVDQDAAKKLGMVWTTTPPKKYLPAEQAAGYWDAFSQSLDNIKPRYGISGKQLAAETSEASDYKNAKMTAMTMALKRGDPDLANKIVNDATKYWEQTNVSRESVDLNAANRSEMAQSKMMMAQEGITNSADRTRSTLLSNPSVAAYVKTRANAGDLMDQRSEKSNVLDWNKFDDVRAIQALGTMSNPGVAMTNEKYDAYKEGMGQLQRIGLIGKNVTGQAMLTPKARLYIQHELANQTNLYGEHLAGVAQAAYEAYAMNPLYREMGMLPSIKRQFEMVVPGQRLSLGESKVDGGTGTPDQFAVPYSDAHYALNVPQGWKDQHPGWNNPNAPVTQDQQYKRLGLNDYEVMHMIKWGMPQSKSAAPPAGNTAKQSSTSNNTNPWGTQQPTIPTVGSKADFDKLPSGATFMEDGKQYRKP